jgi:hypothetical protein
VACRDDFADQPFLAWFKSFRGRRVVTCVCFVIIFTATGPDFSCIILLPLQGPLNRLPFAGHGQQSAPSRRRRPPAPLRHFLFAAAEGMSPFRGLVDEVSSKLELDELRLLVVAVGGFGSAHCVWFCRRERKLSLTASKSAPLQSAPLNFTSSESLLISENARAMRSFDRFPTAPSRIKILPRISVQRISMSVVVVRPLCSGKWLVGPCCTSNRATSFFIRLGNNWRC